MGLLKNNDREIAVLDYNFKKEEIDQELDTVLEDLVRYTEQGTWVMTIDPRENPIDAMYFSTKGIFLFIRIPREIADLKAWEETKRLYDQVLRLVPNIDKKDLSVYVLLNSPITQQAAYGLFQPAAGYLFPVEDIMRTFSTDLEHREEKLLEEFLDEAVAVFQNDNAEDETEETTILVHGKIRPRSSINQNRYFSLALLGGFIGLHKLYTRSFGSFLAYLFTLGFAGVGWMFDLLEILLGVCKDKKKAYIGPFGEEKYLVFIPITIYLILIILFFVIL